MASLSGTRDFVYDALTSVASMTTRERSVCDQGQATRTIGVSASGRVVRAGRATLSKAEAPGLAWLSGTGKEVRRRQS